MGFERKVRLMTDGRRPDLSGRPEHSSTDPKLNPARGILFGLLIGLGVWLVIFLLMSLNFTAKGGTFKI